MRLNNALGMTKFVSVCNRAPIFRGRDASYLALGPELFCLGSSSLNRPHPPHSRAHRDFAAWRLIRDAFAVRERLSDPRVVPGFRWLFRLDMPSSMTPGSSITGWSPFPLQDITTTATGLLCWRDSHPLEWQLASLHLLLHRDGLAPSTPCRSPGALRSTPISGLSVPVGMSQRCATWPVHKRSKKKKPPEGGFTTQALMFVIRRPSMLALPSSDRP